MVAILAPGLVVTVASFVNVALIVVVVVLRRTVLIRWLIILSVKVTVSTLVLVLVRRTSTLLDPRDVSQGPWAMPSALRARRARNNPSATILSRIVARSIMADGSRRER
jgi:hypothetical protein